MALPSFTVTGDINRIAATAGVLGGIPLAGSRVTFTPNVAEGLPLTWDGEVFTLGQIKAVVSGDGTIKSTTGYAIKLLANDDDLNVTDLQWRVDVEGMEPWWFDAPANAATVDLADVAHAAWTTANPTGGVSPAALTAFIKTLGADRGTYYAADYGVSTAAADNAPPLNEMLNDISNEGGGTLVLPPGRLKLKAGFGRSVQQLGNVKVVGTGELATELYADGNGDFPVLFGDWRYCYVGNLQVNANNGWYDAVRMHVDHSTLDHIYVRGFTSKGMALNDGQYNSGTGYLNTVRYCDVSNASSGTGSFGIHTTYRMTDTTIERNYIACGGTNLSVEGVVSRVLNNHLNGNPIHNLESRTGDLLIFEGNILDHSQRESFIWKVESWFTDPAAQASLQMVGNYISHASGQTSGTYNAVSIKATSASRAKSVQFVGNQVEGREGVLFRHALNLEYVDHVVATGNMWWLGRGQAAPVRAISCTAVEVIGNGADNTVVTS